MMAPGKNIFGRVLVCAVLAFCVASSAAQAGAPALSLPNHARFTVQRFGEQFGLGVVTVTTMAQDKQGFLWVGTQTGLFRYDGARVQKWPEIDKIAGHYIDQVLIAPDETVWVKGSLGVGYFTRGCFEKFPLPSEVKPTGTNEALAVDRAGNLFLAVDKGLLRAETRNPSHFRVYSRQDGLTGRVESLALAPDDSIWFIAERKLGHFSPDENSVVIDSALALPNEPSFGLVFDGAGILWLRTANHVIRIDVSKHTAVADDHGVPPANTDAPPPTLDRDGQLLVSSSAGLYWHDHGKWRAITDREGLTSNAVQTALEDHEGTIWVGSSGAGLDRLTGFREWKSWTRSEGLPDNAIWQTVRDRRGRLWVATGRGIAIWEGQRWEVLNQSSGLCSAEVRQMAVAGDGAIWAASPIGGLMRIDPQLLSVQCFRNFAGKHYLRIAVSPDGTIWSTASRGTLVRFEGQGRAVHPVEQTMPETVRGNIFNIAFAPDGVLWASGPDHIFSFDGRNWSKFSSKDGMMGMAVTSLAPLSGREVWVAYIDVSGASHLRIDDNGVAHFEHHEWDVAIVGLDSQNRVWFDGTDGMKIVSPDGRLETLNHADGLIWDDVSPMGVREESDGSYMIATTHGLSHYRPSQQLSRRAAPEVEFTSILLAGKDRLVTVLPEVTYKEGTLVAQFTPGILHSPDQIECRYRLDGLEQEFTTTDLREIRYSGLPPNFYRLEVQCRTNSAEWPVDAAIFEFRVRPAWWQTWWAYVAAAFCIAGAVWLIVVVRTRRLNQSRTELEAAVAQRSAELVDKNKALQEASLTDPLTQTRNRRFFYETVPSEAARVLRLLNAGASQRQKPGAGGPPELIIIMADIDTFKKVNDVYGHSVGDRLLQEHARRLVSVIRKGDVLVRWGGEEFMIVCHATPRENVPLLCQRLLEAVSSTPFDLGDGVSLYKTCSFGWAPFPWSHHNAGSLTVENVIELADKGLYLAKTGGKNQAVGIVPAECCEQSGGEVSKDKLLELPPSMVQVIRTANTAAMPSGDERPQEVKTRS